MSKLILITPEELENLIQSSVRNAMKEFNLIQPSAPENRFMDISEAANFLLMAKQTLYGLTAKREIPHIKKGKRIFFERLSLENWLLEWKNRLN